MVTHRQAIFSVAYLLGDFTAFELFAAHGIELHTLALPCLEARYSLLQPTEFSRCWPTGDTAPISANLRGKSKTASFLPNDADALRLPPWVRQTVKR
jgi:hypothetical protein